MDNERKDLLEAAIARRQSVRSYTNALRLVNGAGDGLKGLILEQYDRHFSAQIFDGSWLREQEELTEFVRSRCRGRYFIVKDRTGSAASTPQAFKTRVWIGDESSRTVVEEYGLKFGVDLNDTLNSGLFLDMRHNRRMVAVLAAHKKILNCFAYTCSFGVHCRAGEAAGVVNVDISAKNLSRGRSNYELNGLLPSRNEFIQADAVQYLKKAVAKENRFDLIILDPPSFARDKGKTFSVKKDLPGLVEAALQVLHPGGFLFVATNFSGFSHEHLKKIVRGSALKQRIEDIQNLGPDEDFVENGPRPEHSLAAVLIKLGA